MSKTPPQRIQTPYKFFNLFYLYHKIKKKSFRLTLFSPIFGLPIPHIRFSMLRFGCLAWQENSLTASDFWAFDSWLLPIFLEYFALQN